MSKFPALPENGVSKDNEKCQYTSFIYMNVTMSRVAHLSGGGCGYLLK